MTTGTRTVRYHAPVTPSGDRFEATMTNRQVTIGLGSRSLHFTMRSSRLHRSIAPLRRARSSAAWQAMAYLGCASLALGLAFVFGSVLRASPPVEPYAVTMAIGDKTAPAMPRHKARPRRTAPGLSTTAPTPAAATADIPDWTVDPAFDASDGALAPPSADIATLPATNGERAVAVYGPPRRVDGKSCRDVSVFVRDTDGKVSVSPSVECKAAR